MGGMAGMPEGVIVENRPREVQAIARFGEVIGTAEFIERVLRVPLDPWQVRICDWIDAPAPKQG